MLMMLSEKSETHRPLSHTLNAWATTKLVEGLIPGREETQLVASIAALLIKLWRLQTF